jgi:hypothetical protein
MYATKQNALMLLLWLDLLAMSWWLQPTCGDINLDLPGRQRFNCTAFGSIFNNEADQSTTVNNATCCRPVRAERRGMHLTH